MWADLAKERLGVSGDSVVDLYFHSYKEDIRKLREIGDLWVYKFGGAVPDVRGIAVDSYFGKTLKEFERRIKSAVRRDKSALSRFFGGKVRAREKHKKARALIRKILREGLSEEDVGKIPEIIGIIRARG